MKEKREFVNIWNWYMESEHLSMKDKMESTFVGLDHSTVSEKWELIEMHKVKNGVYYAYTEMKRGVNNKFIIKSFDNNEFKIKKLINF